MATITESTRVKGVYTVTLKVFGDDRGRFMETFRKEWFPQRSWDKFQTNRSDSAAGVLRGLHYHFKQVDYWFVMRGTLRAALFDLRPDSPTYKASQTIDLSADVPTGLYIPVGVAHGFASLTDATLTYIVDNYYDSTDEYGVAWDDPEVGIDWGVAEPTVSGRDAANPRLSEIAREALPRLERVAVI